MKVVIHKRPTDEDGSAIEIQHFNPFLLSLMTGNGHGWDADRIAYEVGKFTNPPSPEVGKSVDVVQPYINALARGGVTESQAIELIRAMSDKSDCAGCVVAEDTDLPSDRYFRNAWEWED